MVEYHGRVFWMASEDFTNLFMSDPESFLQVPLPTSLPVLLTATERRLSITIQLEDYCPVALVDRKELTKAPGQHIIRFMDKCYSLSNKEAVNKFLRRPLRYVQRAKLPSKRPMIKGEKQVSLLSALTKGKDGKGLEPADMLTFMQASVAELICQSLVDAGEKRPLYPGSSPAESALLFLAKSLRAKNPVSTELKAEKVRADLQLFLSDCALPSKLSKIHEEKAGLEAMGCWTPTDARIYAELCERFDQIFNLTSP